MVKKGQTFRKYTKEEKIGIIEVAKKNKVLSSTFSRWIKEYNEGGIGRLADQRPILGKNPLKGRQKRILNQLKNNSNMHIFKMIS